MLEAITHAIACRLADHPLEKKNLKVEDLAAKVLQHTEGETRQVQDMRKRFVFYLSANHAQAEIVNLVFQAQQHLAEGADTFEPKYRTPSGPRASASGPSGRGALSSGASGASKCIDAGSRQRAATTGLGESI